VKTGNSEQPRPGLPFQTFSTPSGFFNICPTGDPHFSLANVIQKTAVSRPASVITKRKPGRHAWLEEINGLATRMFNMRFRLYECSVFSFITLGPAYNRDKTSCYLAR
jgi:hypothetical protein